MNKPNYLWETLTMIASFVLLWVWFLSSRSGGVSPAIHGLLAVALIALVVIFVRRLKRVREALNETQKPPGSPPGMPFMPPSGSSQNGSHSNNGHHVNKNSDLN
jgi:hypothetical protein